MIVSDLLDDAAKDALSEEEDIPPGSCCCDARRSARLNDNHAGRIMRQRRPSLSRQHAPDCLFDLVRSHTVFFDQCFRIA